ncbi:MAG TPA: ABC transporter ATP-binding protein [Polyangiaceae bacterium]|nr:ABC transporter ATP-binding protein [Polyangiaceae bacterium]
MASELVDPIHPPSGATPLRARCGGLAEEASVPLAIELRGVTKSFGAVRALDGVDLLVERGEALALVGPNGAGKSTLINVVAGLSRANAGTVSVLGHDVVRGYRAARRALGVVPQELVFDPFFEVREVLRLQAGYFGLGREQNAWIEELLETLGLAHKAEAPMRTLSGGMKRRVLIAQALVHRPHVVVLDEPTAGVDVEMRQALYRLCQRLVGEGRAIVLVTHHFDEVEALCSRVAVLVKGHIAALVTTQRLASCKGGLEAAVMDVVRAEGAS